MNPPKQQNLFGSYKPDSPTKEEFRERLKQEFITAKGPGLNGLKKKKSRLDHIFMPEMNKEIQISTSKKHVTAGNNTVGNIYWCHRSNGKRH